MYSAYNNSTWNSTQRVYSMVGEVLVMSRRDDSYTGDTWFVLYMFLGCRRSSGLNRYYPLYTYLKDI